MPRQADEVSSLLTDNPWITGRLDATSTTSGGAARCQLLQRRPPCRVSQVTSRFAKGPPHRPTHSGSRQRRHRRSVYPRGSARARTTFVNRCLAYPQLLSTSISTGFYTDSQLRNWSHDVVVWGVSLSIQPGGSVSRLVNAFPGVALRLVAAKKVLKITLKPPISILIGASAVDRTGFT